MVHGGCQHAFVRQRAGAAAVQATARAAARARRKIRNSYIYTTQVYNSTYRYMYYYFEVLNLVFAERTAEHVALQQLLVMTGYL